MKSCATIFVYIFWLLIINFNYVEGKSRQRRLITFPQGSTFIQMVLGIGLPFEVNNQSVTIGPFLKSLYFLPTNSSYYTNPSIDINQERRKRATSTRWDFYQTLSAAAQFLNYGGKSCVLRTICETAEIPFSEHSDIFSEILHVLFTPSSTIDSINDVFDNEYHAAEILGKTTRNCAQLFSDCKVNFINRFTQTLLDLQ